MRDKLFLCFAALRSHVGWHAGKMLRIERQPKDCSDLTAVIFTVDPSHLFGQCLASMSAQTMRPERIEIVRSVSPASRAAQAGLDLVETPYYVSVDDDMALTPTCFQRLYEIISANDECGEVSWPWTILSCVGCTAFASTAQRRSVPLASTAWKKSGGIGGCMGGSFGPGSCCLS